jgi:hypothetical protein
MATITLSNGFDMSTFDISDDIMSIIGLTSAHRGLDTAV